MVLKSSITKTSFVMPKSDITISTKFIATEATLKADRVAVVGEKSIKLLMG